MDALLTGLGFGLAFWIVTIPVVLLLKPNTASKIDERIAKEDEFHERLNGYWEAGNESSKQQAAALISLSETLRDFEKNHRHKAID